MVLLEHSVVVAERQTYVMFRDFSSHCGDEVLPLVGFKTTFGLDNKFSRTVGDTPCTSTTMKQALRLQSHSKTPQKEHSCDMADKNHEYVPASRVQQRIGLVVSCFLMKLAAP